MRLFINWSHSLVHFLCVQWRQNHSYTQGKLHEHHDVIDVMDQLIPLDRKIPPRVVHCVDGQNLSSAMYDARQFPLMILDRLEQLGLIPAKMMTGLRGHI